MGWANERNVRRLDGTLLLVFSELLRQRTATAAGERLGLSQSGISHALARLREIFDDPLFVRRPRGLEPTGRALELAPRIEALIGLAHEAVAGNSAYNPARSTRRFHIGGLENVMPTIAAPLISTLEAEAPAASVMFRFLLPDDALAALASGDIDLAIGQFKDCPEGMVRETLFQDRYVVVARAGHPMLREPLDLERFCQLPHLLSAPAGAQPGPFDRRLAELGLRRRVAVTAPRLLTAFALAGSTDAVLVAPQRQAEQHAQAFGLGAGPLPAGVGDLPFDVSMVRLGGPICDPAVEWLAARLREALTGADMRAPNDAPSGKEIPPLRIAT